jgi:hypothetical protein
MRYRPFNQAGLAVSELTLTLDNAPVSAGHRTALVFAALEAGINSFDLAVSSSVGPAPDGVVALRAAVEAAGRNLLVLTLRLPSPVSDADALAAQVRTYLDQIGAERFDAVLLNTDGSLRSADAAILHALRADRLAGMVGVDCGPRGPDLASIEAGYDLVATPFGLRIDSALRKRARTLADNNIVLIGYDFDDLPAAARPAPARMGLGQLFKRAPVVVEADPYDFMHRTPNWTPDEIALAYTLTEPALATVRVKTGDIATLHRLAKVVERGLPAGAAAQIEMARFSAPA